MNRAAIAMLALCAAMLFPNWAAAHVLRLDDVQPSQLTNDEYEELTRNFLPIVHECPQVAVAFRVTFRAQEMPEDGFDAGCNLLKETEDVFHAKMQTDPANVVPRKADDDYYSKMDMLVFNTVGGLEDMGKWWSALTGSELDSFGFYGEGRPMNPWGQANPLAAQDCFYCFHTLSHEYVHHLDHMFNQNCIQCGTGPSEGLAEYITNLTLSKWGYIRVIGDGSDLPSALDAWEFSYPDGRRYWWGPLIVRFLFEEHPQVILTLYDYFRTRSTDFDHDYYWSYVNGTLPPLDDDFHRWLREFVPVTTPRQIEAVTIFDDGTHSGGWPAIINLANYFRTSQSELTYTVSLSVPYEVDDSNVWDWLRSEIAIVAVDYDHGRLYLQHGSALGTVEVTVTATAPNGDSAELTFTINVAQDLQTRDIAVRDAVSTKEGETTINLENYYTGPALIEVEFTVASNDADVARVAVRDGRLVITAVAAGEAEVTVRTDYYGRQTTQTFTVTITDDCPAYLCRGFFNGWRWLLLEDGQAAATETTPTE